jgi:hypothetical protein
LVDEQKPVATPAEVDRGADNSSPEDVYAFLTSFASGVERGRAESREPNEQEG